MTKPELQHRHDVLHHALDELLACFVAQRPFGTPTLTVPLGEFLEWSYQQTQEPQCSERLGPVHPSGKGRQS
jgi:hypothetical protein